MPRLSSPGVSTEAQIVSGFRAAILLARGKEEGLRHALLSMEGTARSFWAGALCLLPFLAIRSLGNDALLGAGLPAELIGYVLGWVAFPLASLALVDASGRGPLWPLFIAAWNWANLAQYTALLLSTLLGSLLPPGAASLLLLATLAYALWMEWFVAQRALRISGVRAALFVLLDVALGLFIASLVGRVGG